MSDRKDDLATVQRWVEMVSQHGLNETESRAAEAEIWREFALPITNPVTGMISLQAPISYATHEEALAAMRTLRMLLTQRQMLMMIDEAQPERGVADSGVVEEITGSIEHLLLFLTSCLERWGELPASPEPALPAAPDADQRLHALLRTLGGATHA